MIRREATKQRANPICYRTNIMIHTCSILKLQTIDFDVFTLIYKVQFSTFFFALCDSMLIFPPHKFVVHTVLFPSYVILLDFPNRPCWVAGKIIPFFSPLSKNLKPIYTRHCPLHRQVNAVFTRRSTLSFIIHTGFVHLLLHDTE